MALPAALWDRLPLPAEHAVGLVAGALVQLVVPRPRLASTARPAGWLLVAAGTGLNAWAVAARHGEAIDRPDRLVTDGPQMWSRNPMYAGWTLLHLGVGLVARSPWMLATWPAAFALVHRQVLREERDLAARFGPDFTDYRERVPRYVLLRRRGT
jgi:protein-S-isoprenylcysteine O-methyltransferase Ste14